MRNDMNVNRNHSLQNYISNVSRPGKHWIQSYRVLSDFFPWLSKKCFPIMIREAIPKGQIAIGDGFAIVLNDDGYLTQLGVDHNFEFKQFFTTEMIVKVAATRHGYMGLSESGQIVVGAIEQEFEPIVTMWHGIRDIVGCEDHVLAVCKDGRVLCVDGPGDWTFRPIHEKIVGKWKEIRQVAVGFQNVMGLTREGRVLYHSEDRRIDEHFYDKYSDVVQVDCYSHFYGKDSAMVLRSNGKVSSDTFEGVKKWRNIIQISVGDEIAVGLKSNGTIELIIQRSDLDNLYEAKKWKDLVCVECKFWGIVGITKFGQILSLSVHK